MRTRLLRCSSLLLAVVLLAIGVANQEHADVFRKAISICLECIGIG